MPDFGYVLSMSVKPGVWLGYRSLCAAIALTAIAGCGSSSAAPKSLPQLPRSTPTAVVPSPTPTATSKKAELAAVTNSVAHYFRLLSAPTNTSTVSELQDMVLPGCKCNQVVQSFRDALRRHQHYVGTAHITLARPAYDSSTSAEVLVRFNASAGGLARADGSYVNQVSERRNIAENFYLRLQSTTWKIQQVTLIDRGH
jgi:hypothetical protein